MNRLSRIVKSASSSSAADQGESPLMQSNESKITVTTAVGKDDKDVIPLPPLKVKRVDNYYSNWSKGWKYRNTSAKVTVESVPILQGSGSNDQWKDFSFVVVRTIPRNENMEITYKLVIKSDYILKACKDVVESWPGVSWNSDPLALDPQMFITMHEKFLEYEKGLSEKKQRTEFELNTLLSVRLLNSTIASDYRTTLATVKRLTQHGEITFALLHAILVPRTLFVARCASTGLPRLLKLSSFQKVTVNGKPMQQLVFESVDLIDMSMSGGVAIGEVQTVIHIQSWQGAVRIDSLDVYPVRYHHDEAGLKEAARRRGIKWVSLLGVHHKQYDGIASMKRQCETQCKIIKHNVRSRVIVDRATFRRLNPNYAFAQPVPTTIEQPHDGQWMGAHQYLNNEAVQPPQARAVTQGDILQRNTVEESPDRVNLNEEELLLTPVAIYGFSLGDKAWLEFNIDLIQDVEWNSEAFDNLVLPQGRKDLLRSLVESHHRELGFDDFIKGKGHGLVVNLFGPPGVGKTFSAEATSEHVRRPLYVIGGGDLGTTAADLDIALERVFDMATAWKAIVLIDEADVFLEQRSLHDLERNAMVAVFLRHVEYYRGILFLTTNRVKTFDEAFLSRIHVALHFNQLSEDSKAKVWAAFIKKADALDSVTEEQIRVLAQRDINGRQIKNAVKTAHSLAIGRGVPVSFDHIVETLDAMDEFTRLFNESK
ncbi:P-loop containing nucleoside triphosphate hydrolase protein [Coprinopsis sp. MPI-PUGE-AT-0042]|nr:P-loop containing nucleoside triphosphate hydrolase protein [Coprinopsis sp. MPI-PUGE-AT-0042]